MSANHNLTQPTQSSQLTRRRFLALAATAPAALMSERELLSALVGDSSVITYTDAQLDAITAPSDDPAAEIAHLRIAVEVYAQMAATRRARLAWLEAL